MNFAHIRFIAYFIDFFLFSATVLCGWLKISVQVDYTNQVCFYRFHLKLLKKITTEKAFLPLKNRRANMDTDGVYCLRYTTT